MYKYLTAILFLFFIGGAYAQDLSATMKMPESVEPGHTYITEITINKGPINSYIKFSQKLPTNFKASEIDVKGGSFSFDDSIIKIVWFFPPANNEFKISYKVHVPEGASGTKKIGGKIYYFFNTDRQVFSFDKHFISIGKDKKELVTTSATKVDDKETSGNPTVKEINAALTIAAAKVKSDTVLMPMITKDTTNNTLVQLVQTKDTTVQIKTNSLVNDLPSSSLLATSGNDTLKQKIASDVSSPKPETTISTVKDTVPVNVAIKKEEKIVAPDSTLTPVIKSEMKIQEQVVINVPKVAESQKNKSSIDSTDLIYSVQVGSYKEEVPLATANKFLEIAAKGYKNLKADNGYTTFVVGNFGTKEEANSLKNQMVDKGFKGAFVIGYPAKNVYSSIKNKQIKADPSSANKASRKNKTTKESSQVEAKNTDSKKDASHTTASDSVSTKKIYSIQLGAFKEEVPLATANKFLTLAAKGVKNSKNDLGLTVYTVGSFVSHEDAVAYKNQLIEKGFQGAFVVAIENGAIVK
jgi:SPOR domain